MISDIELAKERLEGIIIEKIMNVSVSSLPRSTNEVRPWLEKVLFEHELEELNSLNSLIGNLTTETWLSAVFCRTPRYDLIDEKLTRTAISEIND